MITYIGEIRVEKSLSDAEREIEVIESKCIDYVVDTMEFSYDGNSVGLERVGERFGFTNTGLDQFGRFLGVKAFFFNKLRPETRLAVFNDVITDAHEIQNSAKVRVYDGKIRGVLGADYTPISPRILIKSLRDAGFDENSLGLRLFIDYEATDLIFFSKEPLSVIDGDQSGLLHSGLILRNDDIGRESASIKCFLYNSETQSGIIYNVSGENRFRFNHTKNIESKIKDSIKFCVEKFVRWFENSGDTMRKLMECKALEQERLIPVLKSIAVRNREIEALFLMEKLNPGRGYSVWDLINTVSEYSARIEDRTRTFELMEIAGAIMNSPKPFAINWTE